MIGKIVSIKDSIVYVQLAVNIYQIDNLIGKNVTFDDRYIGEVSSATSAMLEVALIGEIINNSFISSSMGIPKFSATCRLTTLNEIDIILRAGVNTIFISCKNGQIPQEELYKLDAVANEFGGENVKKVLLATYLGKSDASKNRFVKRAEDMDIIFIDNVHQMRSAAFKGMVKNLINVKPN